MVSLYSPGGTPPSRLPLTHGSGRHRLAGKGRAAPYFFPTPCATHGNTGDFFGPNQPRAASTSSTSNNFGTIVSPAWTGRRSQLPWQLPDWFWGDWLITKSGFRTASAYDFRQKHHPNTFKRFMSQRAPKTTFPRTRTLRWRHRPAADLPFNQIGGHLHPGSNLSIFNLPPSPYKEDVRCGDNFMASAPLHSRGLMPQTGWTIKPHVPFVDNHDFDRTNSRARSPVRTTKPVSSTTKCCLRPHCSPIPASGHCLLERVLLPLPACAIRSPPR